MGRGNWDDLKKKKQKQTKTPTKLKKTNNKKIPNQKTQGTNIKSKKINIVKTLKFCKVNIQEL